MTPSSSAPRKKDKPPPGPVNLILGTTCTKYWFKRKIHSRFGHECCPHNAVSYMDHRLARTASFPPQSSLNLKNVCPECSVQLEHVWPQMLFKREKYMSLYMSGKLWLCLKREKVGLEPPVGDGGLSARAHPLHPWSRQLSAQLCTTTPPRSVSAMSLKLLGLSPCTILIHVYLQKQESWTFRSSWSVYL